MKKLYLLRNYSMFFILFILSSCVAELAFEDEDCENTTSNILGDWVHKQSSSELVDGQEFIHKILNFSTSSSYSHTELNIKKTGIFQTDTLSLQRSYGKFTLKGKQISLSIDSILKMQIVDGTKVFETIIKENPSFLYSLDNEDPHFCIENDLLGISYNYDILGIPSRNTIKFRAF